VDPTGRASDPWGALGKALDIGDAIGIAGSAIRGDRKSAASATYGLIFGTFVGGMCQAAVTAAAIPSAGATLAASGGCLALGSAAGDLGTNYARNTVFN
jgi:hypothetical protein